jgi:hypothetical protein
LLYVERFLKTLEAKALERPALKALNSPPRTLSELYKQLFLKCFESRTAEEMEALRFVFSWLGACMRILTLQEINALMELKFGKKVLDIEDEIAGKCARYVWRPSVSKSILLTRNSILEIASSISPEEENERLQKDLVKARLRSLNAAPSISISIQNGPQDRAGSNLGQGDNTHALPKATEDDSSFLVYFQDTTMTLFIRYENNEQITRPSFSAHLDAFTTCAKVLGKVQDRDDSSEPNTVLHNYAAFAWIKHLQNLNRYDTASDEDAALITHTLISIYTASAVPSMNIFQHTDVSYDDFVEQGPDVVQKWLQRGLTTQDVMTNVSIRPHCEMLAAQPNMYLNTLARDQARHWIYQVAWESASKALMTALKAYQTVSRSHFHCNHVTDTSKERRETVRREHNF